MARAGSVLSMAASLVILAAVAILAISFVAWPLHMDPAVTVAMLTLAMLTVAMLIVVVLIAQRS